MNDRAEEVARHLVRSPTEYCKCARRRFQEPEYLCGACQRLVAIVTDALRAYAEEVVASYAYTVDDPRAAHLHYDGCPFLPYAEEVGELPDNVPDCTCAEAHKGAYWKGQFMLERGSKTMAVKEVRQETWNAGAEAMRAAAVEELKLQSCRCSKRVRALPAPAVRTREEGI